MVKHDFSLPDGTTQQVRGRLDSLIYDFDQHRLCVIEYKTYQSVDPSARLAQAALYSYMLQECVGVPINSAVFSFFPDLKEQVYSWEQLQSAIHQLIPVKLQQMKEWLEWDQGEDTPPPLTSQPTYLCPICPKKKKCQSYFEIEIEQKITILEEAITPLPSKITIPSTQNQSNEKTLRDTELNKVNQDQTGEQLVEVLNAFGIPVDYQGASIGPAFIRVKIKPQIGIKVSSILRLSSDLQVQLGLKQPPLIAPQAGYVSVDLPRDDRQIAHFDRYVSRDTTKIDEKVKVAIGVDLNNQLIEAELSDPNTCHLLVGGTTGSGKSEFLKAMLLSLITRHSPEDVKIVLVDPKRVTFPDFETSRWLYQPVVKDTEIAISLMDELVREMEHRYRKFEIHKCNDLASYQRSAASETKMPRIVCIFDEYADFMAEKEVRNSLELSIKRLGAMARAAGIHLIIATQRPEAQVVTPLIRSNLPGRVALKTASEADSSIILGGKEGSAAYLLGKGDLLYQGGGSLLRLQSLFASPEDIPT